jgi:hypothetical protein
MGWLVVYLGLTWTQFAIAAEGVKTEQDLQREKATAEFVARMKAANYPALFEQAAREFNVPADLLKGIAFAETRWEHLTWPPGETVSPETGMPRPFGIMSLWDNQYFGHSLIEAAKLIGKDPEELKRDPLQNIRGAAALLKKTYAETPLPEGTTDAEIESWRYAVRKFCGIPEPDLNARHALDIYSFMAKGYHQFGIEWNARPVNLEPIRQETRRIVAEEEARRQAQAATNANLALFTPPQLAAGTKTEEELRSQQIVQPTDIHAKLPPMAGSQSTTSTRQNNTWWFIGGAFAALIGFLVILRRPAPPE